MLESILKKASISDVLIVITAAIAIIGFWRGMWNLLDAYFFPSNFILSQIGSILIGIIILFALSRYR